MPLHQQDIEQQIRILQGIPGSDFPADEPEERSLTWSYPYVAVVVALLAIAAWYVGGIVG